jgi:ubiquinone/menaquinone biosynthesis C-methylase UbiE
MNRIEEAQSASVKRAQVEFHNFASLGDPQRALAVYAEENHRRAGVLNAHRELIGAMTPFLEIGANVGHTSYLLANEYQADGFALDLSADALRHGVALMDRWGLARAPVRVAGDALQLPFRDGSLRLVMTYQTLSQFLDIEQVVVEAKRVLAPGGVFLLAEEPLLRLLSLRLYRAPYYELMRPWERKLYDWGLLGYLVKDVIGAAQEENFGIRQNHSMYLRDWRRLLKRHFARTAYQVFVPERGWGERWVKRLAVRLDRHRSLWRAAHLLGGTLAAVCQKAGERDPDSFPPVAQFECYLRCPDCHGPLTRGPQDVLRCACGYEAANEGGVYNLLPSRERAELYPGNREDIADFSLPGHETRLESGFFELEGVFGARYRWMGPRAAVRLRRLRTGPLRLRVRGHAHERSFQQRQRVYIRARANAADLPVLYLDRPGIFVYEADLPDAPEYRIEIEASPAWRLPPDDRQLSVIIGMVRLIPRD